MLEILGAILSIIGVIFAFETPRRFFINRLYSKINAADYDDPQMDLTITEIKRDFWNFEIRLRAKNLRSDGLSAVVEKLYVEVLEKKDHTKSIDKLFLGGQIKETKASKLAYLDGQPGRGILIKNSFNFTPNEIEDFFVAIRIPDGKIFLVNFGIIWHRIDQPNLERFTETKKLYVLGSPHSARTSRAYTPKSPEDFLDSPIILEKSADFKNV